MHDVRGIVKNPSQAMAAEHIDNRIAVFVGIFFNNGPDIPHTGTRPDDINAAHQTFVRHVAEPGCLQFGFPGIIHAAGIAEPTVQRNGNVDIQYISVGQFALIARNTVTDNMIDGNAQGFGIAAITEAGRNRAAGQNKLAGKIVQLSGRDADFDIRRQIVQTFCGQLSGFAHSFKIFRLINRYAVFAFM